MVNAGSLTPKEDTALANVVARTGKTLLENVPALKTGITAVSGFDPEVFNSYFSGYLDLSGTLSSAGTLAEVLTLVLPKTSIFNPPRKRGRPRKAVDPVWTPEPPVAALPKPAQPVDPKRMEKLLKNRVSADRFRQRRREELEDLFAQRSKFARANATLRLKLSPEALASVKRKVSEKAVELQEIRRNEPPRRRIQKTQYDHTERGRKRREADERKRERERIEKAQLIDDVELLKYEYSKIKNKLRGELVMSDSDTD
jgi:hypothetical protein